MQITMKQVTKINAPYSFEELKTFNDMNKISVYFALKHNCCVSHLFGGRLCATMCPTAFQEQAGSSVVEVHKYHYERLAVESK